jgi:hypothetical protein
MYFVCSCTRDIYEDILYPDRLHTSPNLSTGTPVNVKLSCLIELASNRDVIPSTSHLQCFYTRRPLQWLVLPPTTAERLRGETGLHPLPNVAHVILFRVLYSPWSVFVFWLAVGTDIQGERCFSSQPSFILPPFHYIRCFSFVKQMYLDIF